MRTRSTDITAHPVLDSGRATRRTFAKESIETLGVFGGKPLFPSPLHVGKPNLPAYDAVAKRLRKIFERGWLTNRGPEVVEFEERITRITGAKYAVAVCNATVGLELAIRALGMTGEVIVPSFTFVATVHALAWQGMTPVFCDIDPQTHTIDSRLIKELITPRTSGIIGVHLWGKPCDISSLEAIAHENNLRLLFDAAHGFGCSFRDQPLGGFGEAAVFSFHATKFLNTFEGGAVVTNSELLAERIRFMTNFGFADYDHVVSIGTNGKMSEVSAAMGIASLEMMPDIVAWNRRNYEQYIRELRNISGIKMLTYDPAERSNFQYVVVEVDPRRAGLHRDILLEVLHGENVLARRYFYPGVHRMEPYRTTQPLAGAKLRETENLAQKILILPTGSAVGPEDISHICELIKYCLASGAEISKKLPKEKLAIARDLT